MVRREGCATRLHRCSQVGSGRNGSSLKTLRLETYVLAERSHLYLAFAMTTMMGKKDGEQTAREGFRQ